MRRLIVPLGCCAPVDSQFQPPFIYPTTFAEPVIKLSRQGRKDERSIQYYEPEMVKADIVGLMI